MAPKRKAVNAAKEDVAQPEVEEPTKKEAKKDEEAAKVVEPEEPAEKELDDKKAAGSPLKDAVGFDSSDMTLNVVPTCGGRVLVSLSEGGMQYLIAGARANVGVKSGRYLYEVKIVETLIPSEGKGQGKGPKPKQLIRMGFSTPGSSLILGDTEDSVCFDGEGGFWTGNKRALNAATRIQRDQIAGVLLNLDSKSPNANTVSLFYSGGRVSKPMPLPDNLKGKVLCPHICFRNITVQTHFGPTPLKDLPFKCTSLQSASEKDVKVVPSSAPKDGKYEVVMPVAFPDEGTFDWLDSFLEENKKYVEISDRKILEWAKKSGVQKNGGWANNGSNDKPQFGFGLQGMDDFSIQKLISIVAPLVPRNYVIMEVKSNLCKDERKASVEKFNALCYKKVAQVIMGEPNSDWKEHVQEKLLDDKQKKSDAEFNRAKTQKAAKKKQEVERKKAMAARTKQLAALKEKAEIARKAAEEAKKKVEGEKEGEDKKDGDKDAEKKEDKNEKDDKEEKPKEEEAKEEEEADEEEDTSEPPKLELSDEEKKQWFFKHQLRDLSDTVLNASYAQFSVPEKAEGFDDIRYVWQNAAGSKGYLDKWVLERKLTARVEELQPGQFFKDTSVAWQKDMKEFQSKQTAYATKKKAEKKADDEEGDEEEEAGDIFAVENVSDVGGGVPLFEKFGFEDWALFQLRYEFGLMVKAFKKDVDDAEHPGIHEDHLNFYYNRYFGKNLTPSHFGKTSANDLLDLVKDVVAFSKETKCLTSQLSDDSDSLDIFVKLTEEIRRERQRRIDAGDETARLKFNKEGLMKAVAAGAIPAAAGMKRQWPQQQQGQRSVIQRKW